MNRKDMVKIIVGIAITFPILASNGLATTTVTDATGNGVAVADGTGGGSGLEHDLSPGVVLSMVSEPSEYALATTNNNAQTAYRLEYAIYSPKTGYYQIENDETTATTEWTPTLTVGTNPFAGTYTYMGNSTN